MNITPHSLDHAHSDEDEAEIRAHLGQDTVDYLRKKHSGGTSNSKGGRYEAVFAVVEIAEAARQKHGGCTAVFFDAQVPLCFVDDLRVTDSTCARRQYFQLKNSPHLAWSSGRGSLAYDFAGQAELCRFKGEAAVELVLVTSDAKTAQQLLASMPSELTACSHVRWFPWEESLPLLCQRWSHRFSALAWLSRHKDPTFHDVLEVLGVLCGMWATYDGTASAYDVISAARGVSPTLIRPLISDEEISRTIRDDFKAALATIENFSYSVVKGFFSWEYRHQNGAIESGVLSHDCLSEHFQALQSRLARLAPLTFEMMEDQLL